MKRLATLLSLALAGCAFATPPRDTAGPRPRIEAEAEAAPADPPKAKDSTANEESVGASYDSYYRTKSPTYEAPALTAYLNDIARRLSAHAGRSEITFRVSITDSPEYNAWSFAGGYIHVARGTLALATSEAEIAAVMAHEIGHIAVKSSMHKLFQTTAVYQDDPMLPYSEDLHHRDGEMQADRVGFDLMRASGYALRAMPRIYRALQIMDLLSVHLDPTMIPRVARFSRYGVPADGGEVGRDTYLDRIDGIIFGDDPRDGVVRGQAFTCARCNLAFDLPAANWKTEPQPGGIEGRSSSGDRSMSFTHLGRPGAASEVRAVFLKTLVKSSLISQQAAGLPVLLGTVEGKNPPEEMALIMEGDETYLLAAKGEDARPTLRRALATLRRPRAADMAVTPKRLHVRTVAQAGRFEEVLARTCKQSKDSLQHALLNDMGLSAEIAAGTRLKCVEP